MLIDTPEKLASLKAQLEGKPVVQTVHLGGVVIYKNKVLALCRAGADPDSPLKWVLPGGNKAEFETPEAALVREMLEETGLHTRIIAPISVFSYQVLKDDHVRDTTQINFLLSIIGSPKVKLNEEHDKYIWFTREAALSSTLSKEVKDAISRCCFQSHKC